MNVVVCLKQVPGTTQVKIEPATNTLVRQGIKNIINPFDTYALEEGVRLKERYGGRVTVLTMGPPQAEEALKEAISLGADDAVLLSDRDFAGADTLATSYTLSRAILKIGGYDLIICGRQTLDGDTGQVGPGLAEALGLPLVSYVSRIEEANAGMIRARRMVEDGHEVVESPLPAVITVVKEINTPRLPSLRGIARARGYKPAVWSGNELDVDRSLVGLAGSVTRVIKVFVPQRTSRAEVLQGEPDKQVDGLLARLKQAGVI
ncbi:MAG: electron transfer flavoprotein subunit beta/FixA family protein [Chloroflexi bacterium]|nr:electron transfer flavoprotein subunit beta/FixA family protein [Chloroflexota bacterium]